MKLPNKYVLTSMLFGVTITLLSGCDGGGGSSNPSTQPNIDNNPSTTITGQFIDSAVIGLNYSCSSGTTGITNTNGEFTCNENDTVTFSINGYVIGSATAQAIISPKTLQPNDDTVMTNIAQLLQTLDSDSNPDNGITLDVEDEAVKALNDSVDVRLEHADFDSAITTYIGKVLVDEATALAHLEKSVDLGTTDDTNTTVPNSGFSYGRIDAIAYPELIVDLYNEAGYNMEYSGKGYHISLTQRDGLVSYDKDNNILWAYDSADADDFKEIVEIIDDKVLVKSVSGFSFPKDVGLHYFDAKTGQFIENIPVANKNISQDFYTLEFNADFTAYLEHGNGAGVYDFTGKELGYFDAVNDIEISNTHIVGATDTTTSLYDITGTKLWDKNIECKKVYLADDYVLCASPIAINKLEMATGDVLNSMYLSGAPYLAYMGVSSSTIVYADNNLYVGLDTDTFEVKYSVANNGHLERSFDKNVLYSSTIDNTLQANSFETGEVLWTQSEITTLGVNLTFKRDTTILVNDGATSNRVFGTEL